MIRIPLFGNSSSNDEKDTPPTDAGAAKPAAPHPLDATTGGAFSAATSGERAARVRAWLATEPDAALMQEVYRELSSRDKGAAKALREKLDEIKRSKGQEALGAEWAAKADALLQAKHLNIADAMAWQRDAAKAGAPLAKEPLLTLKNQLAERIKGMEDLHTRIQVQREAAVLLAQRIELLSTKSWRDADAVEASIKTDVQHWQEQAQTLQQDAYWNTIDAKYPTQIEGAQQQLEQVVLAYTDALSQTRAAADDAAKPLPPVPVWADELRAQRGQSVAEATTPAAEVQTDKPEQTARRLEAKEAVEKALHTLEQELASGQSKSSFAAAQALRSTLKSHARFLDAALDVKAQAALAKAGELKDWQRWRADQLRIELIQQAEALIHREIAPAPLPQVGDGAAETAPEPARSTAETPASHTEEAVASEAASTATATDTESAAKTEDAGAAAADTPLPTSPHSPRKLQEMLRNLREQWKQTDQGGVPNHGLWRRFDQACNEAYRIVQVWLDNLKQQASENKALRQQLMDEVKAWGETLAAQSSSGQADWKAAHRTESEFARRWREAGHLSEKVFAELQPQWKATLQQATQPLQAAQKDSIATRQQLIEQATTLAAEPLRIDAIKALQQQWQQEAQRVPLERRLEQKLWDAFRKPIDAAFQRKTQQREQVAAALSQRDQAVLDAAKALDAATASGDAQAIQQAMQALDAAMQAQQAAPADAATDNKQAETPAAATAPVDTTIDAAASPASDTDSASPKTEASEAPEADAPAAETTSAEATDTSAATTDAPEAETAPAAEPEAPAKPAPTPPKPVVAMRRSDDRPGARPATTDKTGGLGAGRGQPRREGRRDEGRPDRRDDRRAPGRGDNRNDARKPAGAFDRSARTSRFDDAPRAPRLGDAAFRAQRDALERAQGALRKLAVQAHGETLTQVLTAWEQRNSEALPSAQELGKAVGNAQRTQWVSALTDGKPAQRPAAEALLRLEMAAEAPTPAEHLDARRALQLKLLTQRNDPTPAQTWAEDVAHVLAAPFDSAQGRRLQNVLRVLLKK